MAVEGRKWETKYLRRSGHAEWSGALRGGTGRVSTTSGMLRETPYSYNARFEEDGHGSPATNPEELLGAAHAACFSMALANELTAMGHVPEHVATDAFVTLAHEPGGWAITRVDLRTRARLPKADIALLRRAAVRAKANCPVSRLFDTQITLEAELEGETEEKVAAPGG